MRRCAVVTCPSIATTTAAGAMARFCPPHQLDYEASPEAAHPRASSMTDFVNRTWKETQAIRANEKWANATPEQREEWKKGGFGR